MHALKQLIVLALLGLLAAGATAQSAFIRLTAYPSVSVADGRTPVTITAEIRDHQGRLVPDGTQVVLSSAPGQFREGVLRTANGLVQGILVPDSTAGIAKITASCLTFSATANLEYEFVADRSMLSSATEYVEFVSPTPMMYSVESKVIMAAAPDRGVYLRYRDVEIHADDLQYNIPMGEVRARKARLKVARHSHEYDELYLKLALRRGYGMGTYQGRVPTELIGFGRYVAFQTEERLRYGPLEITSSGHSPAREALAAQLFAFEDISESASHVAAKKAVIFPRREIQFHQAEIFVGGARAMKMPLFQVSIYGTTPVLTDGILNVYDNQLSVNYPHYLSLKPGQTSLLRFRMGQNYGRTFGALGGTFLDYELNWNRGDEMQGGVTVSGLLRNDWGVGARQFMRLGDRTTIVGQVDLPGRRALFGSTNISHQLDGYALGLTANTTRSLRGPKFVTEQTSMVLERDPVQLRGLPVRLYYGVTASHFETQTQAIDRTQSSVGLRLRGQVLPINLDRETSLHASFSASHLQGHNTLTGLTYFASTTLSRRLGRSASLFMTYDFSEDGYNSALLGRHRMSAQASYAAGRTDLRLFGTKSLDFDRSSLQGDLSYSISNQWRLVYSYTFDQYLGDNYLDYAAAVAYNLGGREVGLTWSNRTKRFGVQILGARF
jgi:hypothetical protein